MDCTCLPCILSVTLRMFMMKGGVCNTRAHSNCVGNTWPSKGNLCHLPSKEINLPLLTFALISIWEAQMDTVSSYFTWGTPGSIFRTSHFTYGLYIGQKRTAGSTCVLRNRSYSVFFYFFLIWSKLNGFRICTKLPSGYHTVRVMKPFQFYKNTSYISCKEEHLWICIWNHIISISRKRARRGSVLFAQVHN